MNAKPKALVFGSPFEGRFSYIMAGLSHYYDLDFYFNRTKRFRFNSQIFYKWAYSKNTKFFNFKRLQDLLEVPAGYDALFIFPVTVSQFFGWYENQAELTEFVLKMKEKAKKIYWLDLGEAQYHNTSRPEFWDNIDIVLKGQVFKKEYEPLFYDLKKIALFQGPDVMESPAMVEENMKFDFEKYRHKILPFPFTPSISRPEDLDFSKIKKVYDIAANTRTGGNGALRFSIIKLIEKNLPSNYKYSFDYDEQGIASNVPLEQRGRDWYMKSGSIGKKLFRLQHLTDFYPTPAYLHNLSHSKCYLGLGWTFSSLRTADCWGAGTILINFSMEKCVYGIPAEDGYNYISIGERDEMTDDNQLLKPGFESQIMGKVEAILANPKKQAEIAANGKRTYEEYFSSPKQFAKKIFIEKIST